jgi:hypothetical protein
MLIVVGIVLLVVLAVGAGLRPAGRAEIDGFAAAAGVRTTEASRRFIGHYLATSRRLRTILVVAALILPGLVAQALGVHRTGYSAPLQWVLVACMFGTLWAETTGCGRARIQHSTAVAEDLLVADHAVRAASVRMVAAIATIMGLLNLVGGLVTYSGALPGPLAAVCGVLTVASLIGCLVAWSFRRSGVAPLPPALRREPERAAT